MKTPTDGAMKAVELKGRSWSNQYMRGIIASGVDPNGLVKNGTLPAITYYCPECRSSFELVEDVVNCPYCPIDPPTMKAAAEEIFRNFIKLHLPPETDISSKLVIRSLVHVIDSHTAPTVKADRLDLSNETEVMRNDKLFLIGIIRSAYLREDAQELEIGELVGGLEFYADEDNWADDWEINETYNGIIPTDCDRKGGKRARQDLAKYKENHDRSL